MNDDTIERINGSLNQLRSTRESAGGAQPSPQQNEARRSLVQEVITNSAQLAAEARIPEREALDAFQRGLKAGSQDTTTARR
jgi:hypothetical protein